MKPDNHYEVAFEAYLRRNGVAALPIVEARRSYLDDDSVKSPDFLVIGAADARLVVDVKGRKFGGSAEKPRQDLAELVPARRRDESRTVDRPLRPRLPRRPRVRLSHRPRPRPGPEHAGRVFLSRRALPGSRRRGRRLSRRDADAQPALGHRPPPHRRVPRDGQSRSRTFSRRSREQLQALTRRRAVEIESLPLILLHAATASSLGPVS